MYCVRSVTPFGELESSSASLLLRGIAVCFLVPSTLIALGKVSPRSGFPVRLRYLVHHEVSIVSSIRLVRRPIFCAPVALLLGRFRKDSRFAVSAPFEAR